MEPDQTHNSPVFFFSLFLRMRQDTMSSGSGVKYTLTENLDSKYHTKKVFHLSLNKQIF